MNGVSLPRKLKYSSKFEINNIDIIRSRIRKNSITHMKFDERMCGREGNKYFDGIYEPNNPNHVEEN